VPAGDVRLGGREIPAASTRIDSASATVAPEVVQRLLDVDDATIRVWYVPAEAAGNAVELHERALQDLRALGYLE